MNEAPNLVYIKELADGSKDFEQKLIAIITREFAEEKNEFFENYNGKLYLKTAENVHKIKHKIGMLGFEKGYQTAVDFEEGLKENDPSLYSKFILILESIEHFLKTL
ncbi:Hpt domain-containing protein [Aquimarina sediminis]|uniref:Hpt domain-containing protein n=1 Tax=Aquimarina sediminis TaxID=2070536 RepID=UPI000CA04A4D|nr:Hpt domain-containing protein [Aquimarina sediminis]